MLSRACKNSRIFPFKYNRHEGDTLYDQLLVSLSPRRNECSPDREHCIVAPLYNQSTSFRSRASTWFNLRQYGIRGRGLKSPLKLSGRPFIKLHSPHRPQSKVYLSPLSAYTETRVIQYDSSATLCSVQGAFLAIEAVSLLSTNRRRISNTPNHLRLPMAISAFTILIITYVSYRQSGGFVGRLIAASSMLRSGGLKVRLAQVDCVGEFKGKGSGRVFGNNQR